MKNMVNINEIGMLLTKAGDDRRERQVRLNPAGITALKAAFPHWQRTHLRVVETLGVEELARLRTLLDKVGGLSGSE